MEEREQLRRLLDRSTEQATEAAITIESPAKAPPDRRTLLTRIETTYELGEIKLDGTVVRELLRQCVPSRSSPANVRMLSAQTVFASPIFPTFPSSTSESQQMCSSRKANCCSGPSSSYRPASMRSITTNLLECGCPFGLFCRNTSCGQFIPSSACRPFCCSAYGRCPLLNSARIPAGNIVVWPLLLV